MKMQTYSFLAMMRRLPYMSNIRRVQLITKGTNETEVSKINEINIFLTI